MFIQLSFKGRKFFEKQKAPRFRGFCGEYRNGSPSRRSAVAVEPMTSCMPCLGCFLKNKKPRDFGAFVENIGTVRRSGRTDDLLHTIPWVLFEEQKAPRFRGFCGEYRSRTDDLLHAMQAL